MMRSENVFSLFSCFIVILLLLNNLQQNDASFVRNRWQKPQQEHPSNTIPSTKLTMKTPSNYRVSPIDGSFIAMPTKDQLKWQEQEIGVLIHYNMATYIDIDGCNSEAQLVPDISLFNPTQLNTDNWMDSIQALGARYAVLVAKHNCGFTTWPTKVSFQTTNGVSMPYNYSIQFSPVSKLSVVGDFIYSASIRGVQTGFYYSIVVNNFLNVQNGKVQNGTLGKGQVPINQTVFEQIVMEHLTELWSSNGDLQEIWFDGGYLTDIQSNITNLLNTLQPHAGVFNGYGLATNPLRWIGNELGNAPDPTWSTGTSGGGDPNSQDFVPAECDTTLQAGDRWFWGSNTALRSLKELVGVYHTSVGHNCLLMMDLTPDRTGLIPATYASRYKQLGDWIRSCYGTPIKANSVNCDSYHCILSFDHPTTIDRIVLQEDQTMGQVIRSYTVSGMTPGSNNLTPLSNGTSIGHKKIDLFSNPLEVVLVNFTITRFADKPVIRRVDVYLCENPAA